MAPSSAVARFVCLSMVRLRSVSSGNELTAAIRPRVFCCASAHRVSLFRSWKRPASNRDYGGSNEAVFSISPSQQRNELLLSEMTGGWACAARNKRLHHSLTSTS